MDSDPKPGSLWTRLNWDLTDLILSRLPLRSVVLSSAVCRHWRSVITDPSFSTRIRNRKPWFFLFGQNNVFHKQNQAFGYDPESEDWIRIPNHPQNSDCFSGAGGLAFSFGFSSGSESGSGCSTRFSYSRLPAGPWRETPPLSFSRLNPLVGVFDDGKFIVVGGARFIGGLVDIEDRPAAEIYDPAGESHWELCPPLPVEFRLGGSSSQWLSSCVINSTSSSSFVVIGIYSGFVSAFDLTRKEWAPVRILRPPGVLLSFLVACGDRTVLAGLCSSSGGESCCFRMWEVNYATLHLSEIAVMPKELMGCIFDSEDEDTKFASLRCVGLDGVVYVFNEDHHRGYPACVCDIGGPDGISKWRKVPPLPGPVNRFHKVVAFASPVSIRSGD